MKRKFINCLKKIRILQKKNIHKKEVKIYLKEFSDVTFEQEYKKQIKNYWKKYDFTGGWWQLFYFCCNGRQDVRYIGNDIFYSKIIGKLNYSRYTEIYENKNLLDILVQDIKQPKTLLKNINGVILSTENILIENKKDLLKLLEEKKIIIKAAIDSNSGNGINVFNISTEKELALKYLYENKNYIVQEYIVQHQDLRVFNTNAINTIRIVSFLWEGKVHILGSYLRIGNQGEDFVIGDTIRAEILPDGRLDRVLDQKFHFVEDSSFCEMIRKIKIPNYEQVLTIVKKKHQTLPFFKIIAWDLAIDDTSEVVLLEMNVKWPGIEVTQCFGGPLFGELTDNVMEWVFSNGDDILDGICISF